MKYDYYTREGIFYGCTIRSLMAIGITDRLDTSLRFHVSTSDFGRKTVRDFRREILIFESKSQQNRSEYRSLVFSPFHMYFNLIGETFELFDVNDSTVDISEYTSTQRFINGIYYALYGYLGTNRNIDGSAYVILSMLEKIFPLPDGVHI